MGTMVQPETFLLGYPAVHRPGLVAYLKRTKQEEFLEAFDAAVASGLSEAEALCSFYAKLCYKSLVADGRNPNVTKVRSVRANLENAFDQGHGSIYEHVCLNFVITDCSRVFTHELVRHRIGTAFSQTSGRFCRLDNIDLVWDPILEGCEDLAQDVLRKIEDTVYLMECRKGLRKPPDLADVEEFRATQFHPELTLDLRDAGRDAAADAARWVPDNAFNFDRRKQITSAIRRIAPNGQSNEIGLSINIRALRQVIQVRTAAGAEREIRVVFNQIYDLVRERFPLVFYKARTKVVDGLRAVYGMKTQPFEIPAHDPEALRFFTPEELTAEVERREVPGG